MKDLVIVEKDGQESIIPVEEVKKFIAPNATEAELWAFMGLAKAYNLNPFKREIHFVKYGSGESARAQVIIGYEVYLKRAVATGKLEWWKVEIEGTTAADMAAVFRGKRSDWAEPFEWRVYRAEFDKGQSTWKAMPKFMLMKCAIGQGFRLLFPEELGGMPYSPEEINGHTSEQINNASAIDAEFEFIEPEQKVEPGEDEKAKVLALILKKIAAFDSIEELEDWQKKQTGLSKSAIKDEILAAIAEKRKELDAKESETSPDDESPGTEPGEMSEADQLLAKLREAMEAQGHVEEFISRRLDGLAKKPIAELAAILEIEMKRKDNGK